MNITVKNDYRIEAEISADEMENIGADFAALDYSKRETRMFLWHIIEEMRADGIDIDMSGRVLIEAFDNKTGGCIIAFTLLPHDSSGTAGVKQLVKNISAAALVNADTANELAAFSRAVGDIRSDLYLHDGRYELFIFPDEKNKERISRILPEYYGVCSASVPLKLAQCREKGKLLRGCDAVHMLSKL